MKVHEFQAKELLARYGVPVPHGRVATSASEARQVAAELGVPTVVKAQIHAGGRGKGGGIKLASTPDAAEAAARQVIGMTLVTPQTGPEGRLVRRVLVEEQTAIARELYLAVLIDSSGGGPVIIGSAAGGMEIEEVAAAHPEAIHRVAVDPAIDDAFETEKKWCGVEVLNKNVSARFQGRMKTAKRLGHFRIGLMADESVSQDKDGIEPLREDRSGGTKRGAAKLKGLPCRAGIVEGKAQHRLG